CLQFLIGPLSAQSDEGWNVRYNTKTEICVNKGSTVIIWSSYDYPAEINNVSTTVDKRFWFIETEGEPVDLREDPEYKDRVRNRRYEKKCRLEISEVRESDSGVYKFRLITNHENRSFTGEPGVRLTVEDAPQTASVSLTPPGEILEGSSVTLTCSIDANPAANFTWFKENKDSLKSEEPTFTISNFTAEDGGLYICVAQNQLGQQNSTVQVWVGSGKLETFPPWSLAGRQNCPLIDEPEGLERDGLTSGRPAEDQVEIQHATVTFTQRQEDPLYSTIDPVKAKRRRDSHEDKEDVVIQ
uniref:B-cell receptor CD22 n=1 Tax=Oryzias latipes TaxID=8090 RepID=H2L393_ORYLA